MEQIRDAITSYLIAVGMLFCSNIDQIVTWGGFVLLVVRLIADVPRAYRTLNKALKRGV